MLEDKYFQEYPERLCYKLKNLNKLYLKISKKESSTIKIELIDFVISSLEIFIEFYDSLTISSKKHLEEEIGEIIISLLYIDNLTVDKETKEILGNLVDLADSHALVNLNKKCLVKNTLGELICIRERK